MEANGSPIPEGGKKSLSQTRDASFSSPAGDNIESIEIDQNNKNTYQQNDCQLLLKSLKSSFKRRKIEKRRALPKSRLSPMAARAHMNILRKKIENLKPNPEKHELPKQTEGKAVVQSAYKPGKAAERFMQYMFQQRNRPQDNNIQFWRNLVAEFFAPSAKKRWCISLYKNVEQIDSLFKVEWQCNMCNQKPCYGYEMNEELIPRLHKNKYDTGLLEEHLQLMDTAKEYEGECGQIFLHYSKAVEESQYEQLRIVRNGQLRLVFSPDLKIRSWEFCAQDHEEYIRRNSIVPPVSQLGAALQNYRLSTKDSSSATPEETQKHIDLFITSAHQMVEALGVPCVSQIGVVKRYVRSLQISEVLNIMHSLIDYSHENRLAPKESIAKYPRFDSKILSEKKSDQQPEKQQSPAASLAPYLEPSAGNNGSDGTAIGVLDFENKNENIATIENNIHGGISVTRSNEIPKKAQGNYPPHEDDLLDKFVDFEGVHELLE